MDDFDLFHAEKFKNDIERHFDENKIVELHKFNPSMPTTLSKPISSSIQFDEKSSFNLLKDGKESSIFTSDDEFLSSSTPSRPPVKYVCHVCQEIIGGKFIIAMGKAWHPHHFFCACCSKELGNEKYFVNEGRPYCQKDYYNLFRPKCQRCDEPCIDVYLNAQGKSWHMEHFLCEACGRQIGEQAYFEKNGKPYCRDDYCRLFAKTCVACNRPILEFCISAMMGLWHPGCFKCRECKIQIIENVFYPIDGDPVCKRCIPKLGLLPDYELEELNS